MPEYEPVQSLSQVGLSVEEEERAWELYELIGSMEEVAKVLNVRPYLVKMALCKDQIRLIDVQTVRMEQTARRWEEIDCKAASATNMMLDIMVGLVKHIEACKAAGCDTDLVDPIPPRPGMERARMTVTHAYQWLLGSGQLDKLSKVGFNAAKISETMRLLAFDKENAKGSNKAQHDPSRMTDTELWELISEMESAGRPLPWGVQQWKDAQVAKQNRGLGR